MEKEKIGSRDSSDGDNSSSGSNSSSYWIWISIIVLVLIVLIFFYAIYLEKKAYEPITETAAAQTELYFCPKDGCEQVFVDRINSANKIECAFYDLDSKELIAALKDKDSQGKLTLFLETDNTKEAGAAGLKFTKDKNSYLMHDKFCILDNHVVITGSTNPTENCFNRNNNNLLIIDSAALARNYQSELNALLKNKYNEERTKETEVVINGIKYKNYFCPQDSCREHVYSELNKAQKSIYFMTFSFTDNALGDLLIEKSKHGINVTGVMEKRQIDEWSEYHKFKKNRLPAILDYNKYTMHQNISLPTYYPKLGVLHHKVFIIDNRTVITGSYNPTANGDSRNNENILIIHDENIAQQFTEEFTRIYGRNMP